MSEIKYICFDIGNVANENAFDDILSKGQERWGSKFSESNLMNMVFFKDNERDYWREFQNGILAADDYLGIALNSGGFAETQENKEHFRSCLESWCGKPYQKITDLASRLMKNGYHTSVLSNNNEIMYHTPSAVKISSIVDVSLSSHEIGVSKPDSKAYSILLEKINADDPSEVIFIDDKMRNIEGAEKVGIDAFHFRSTEISMDEAFNELLSYLASKNVRV